MKTSLFIGRWQVPILHEGHRALIQSALSEGHNVVVGIRDTKFSKSDPYTADQRRVMIHGVFGNQVQTVVVPDPGCDLEVCYGRGVGYSFREIRLPEQLESVSGTAVRSQNSIFWFTGNSGAGKTTLAERLCGPLRAVVLDGDEMRASISVGAGFSLADRLEHNLRVARLAGVLSRRQNVIVAVIAPTFEIRAAIEGVIAPIWVYVKRDLPERADYPYRPPHCPDITVDMDVMSVDEAVCGVLERIREGV